MATALRDLVAVGRAGLADAVTSPQTAGDRTCLGPEVTPALLVPRVGSTVSNSSRHKELLTFEKKQVCLDAQVLASVFLEMRKRTLSAASNFSMANGLVWTALGTTGLVPTDQWANLPLSLFLLYDGHTA